VSVTGALRTNCALLTQSTSAHIEQTANDTRSARACREFSADITREAITIFRNQPTKESGKARPCEFRADDDCHQKLGLWILKKLVERTSGRLWILSGSAQYLLNGGVVSTHSYSPRWSGVVIELEIPVNSEELVSDNDIEDFGLLAEELAI